MGQGEVGWKGCEQGQEGPAAVPVLERRGRRAPPECPAHPAPTATGSASESRAARRKRARGGCIPLLSPGLPMQPTISIHSGENPDYPPEARTPLAEGRGAPCPGQVRMGECGVPGVGDGEARARTISWSPGRSPVWSSEPGVTQLGGHAPWPQSAPRTHPGVHCACVPRLDRFPRGSRAMETAARGGHSEGRRLEESCDPRGTGRGKGKSRGWRGGGGQRERRGRARRAGALTTHAVLATGQACLEGDRR